MNKVILISLFAMFLFSGLSVHAQASNEIKCSMTVEEILRSQPFDIDHPTSEDAKNITITLFEELTFIYNELNNNQSSEITEHIELIHIAIESAKAIEMNYSMFDEDLEFIETIN